MKEQMENQPYKCYLPMHVGPTKQPIDENGYTQRERLQAKDNANKIKQKTHENIKDNHRPCVVFTG